MPLSIFGPWTKCTFTIRFALPHVGPPEPRARCLLHNPTRRNVGYFGAVRLRDGKFFFRRETDKFNAATCWKFLQHLQAASTRTNDASWSLPTTRNTIMHAFIGVEGGARGPLRARLPPRLQPGVEPHRASLETHPSPMPAQSILRASG